MAAKLQRTVILIVLALIFGAIVISTAPEHRTQAGGGFPAHVLTLKENVESAVVVDYPDGSPNVVLELRPGDRVLRTSGGIIMSDEGVYIPVYTPMGESGWLLNGEDITESISAVYATSSQLETGAVVSVVAGGDGAPCRAVPTSRGDTVRSLAEGELLTITDGPYPAELGLWWPVALSDNERCWIYDAPGLFVIVNS